jgi:16S rRNA (uracil1498-N3)-methyltransferase
VREIDDHLVHARRELQGYSVALIGRLGPHHNFGVRASQRILPARRRCLIIARVARRLHVDAVRVGEITLDADEAHHARDVLRLGVGTAVEVFDDEGRVAGATLTTCDRDAVVARVEQVEMARTNRFGWTIASAVPKGDRAEWMIEKLSELGTGAFVPLATARSVVLPEGKNKRERWQRIAIESAKQSRRAGVMRIGELTRLERAIVAPGWYLSTAADAVPVDVAVEKISADASHLTLFIGPEGGWTDEELSRFAAAGLTPVALTGTILRVETAAVTAAAIVAAVLYPRLARRRRAGSPEGES